MLSFPILLRLLLAAQPKLMKPVLRVVHRVIMRHLLGQAGLQAEQADSGAVMLIQPSLWMKGSAANLNIHLQCVVLVGVYRCGAEGEPVFLEVPAPTDEAPQAVLHKIITRLTQAAHPQGVLVEEQGQTYTADDDTDSDEASVIRPLQGAMPRDAHFKQTLCADIHGFSLHAAVRCGTNERQALEQLCCYITRPA